MRPTLAQRVADAQDALGVQLPGFPSGMPHAERIAAYERWKVDVLDPAWKALVKQHHPDRGGDVETMKRVNNARDTLLSVTPAPPAPPRQQVVHVIFEGVTLSTSASASTSSSTVTSGRPFWVRWS